MQDVKSNLKFKPVDDPVYTHALSQPIAYGESEIAALPIRRPTSRDLLFIGNPVIADPTSGKEAKLDLPVCLQMASALTNLPEKVFEKADPGDLVDLFWKIASFFIPGWQHLLPAIAKLKDRSSTPDEPPAA